MKKLFVILGVGILLLTSSSIFAETPGNELKDQNLPNSKKDIIIKGIPIHQSDGEVWCWPSNFVDCVKIHVPDFGKGSKTATIYDKNGGSKTMKIKDYGIQEGKEMTVVKLVR